MFFSIIVPIYNIADYLSDCISSILNQDFNDYELILVNDGSTDKCLDICKSYSNLDDRIIVIDKKNGGLVSARKAGAKVATGKYILNIDGDDYIEDHYLSTIYNCILTCQADVVTWGWTEFCGDSKRIVKHKIGKGFFQGEELNSIRSSFLYDRKERGVCTEKFLVSVWCKAVRNQLYKDVQILVDDTITQGEDTAFTLYLIELMNSVYVMDYYGYMYRQNNSSMMHRINDNDFDNLCYLIQTLESFDETHHNFYYNQIRVCCFSRFLSLVKRYAKSIDNSKTFKYVLDNNVPNHVIEIASKAVIFHPKILDLIKIEMIRKRDWRMLYQLLKLI